MSSRPGCSGRPSQPNELYTFVTDYAAAQIAKLDGMLKGQEGNQQSRAVQMRAFWASTLPAALQQGFTQVESPVAANLRALQQVVEAGTAG